MTPGFLCRRHLYQRLPSVSNAGAVNHQLPYQSTMTHVLLLVTCSGIIFNWDLVNRFLKHSQAAVAQGSACTGLQGGKVREAAPCQSTAPPAPQPAGIFPRSLSRADTNPKRTICNRLEAIHAEGARDTSGRELAPLGWPWPFNIFPLLHAGARGAAAQLGEGTKGFSVIKAESLGNICKTSHAR